MNTQLIVSAAVLALAASVSYAADEADKQEEDKSPWTATAGLGFVNASGNTNTESLTFKFDIAYEIERWKHEANLETLRASTDDITTADRKLFTAQTNYKFRPLDYFWATSATKTTGSPASSTRLYSAWVMAES